jgi:hypothetical protein
MSGRSFIAVALALWPSHALGLAPKRAPAPVEDVADASEGEAPNPPSDEDASDEEASDEPARDEPARDEPAPADEQAPPEDPAANEPAPPPTSPAEAAPSGTHDVPADDFENELGVAPGGYHGHGVILERAPPDGQNRIIVGSILVPLGAIASVTSAVGTWLTVPQHCAERLGSVGIEADSARCQGLFTFNVIRVSYGVLMLGTGATILALGMIQRGRYRKWKLERGMRARVEPMIGLPTRGSASLGLRLRF